MEQAPTLVVLAAGMGSRYGKLKQLDSFGPNGETIMDYSIYDAVKAGFGKIVFVIRKVLEEEFTATILSRVPAQVPVVLAFQELQVVPGNLAVPASREKPWGTGHALWSARAQIQEPFAVINADDFYGYSSFRQVADFLKNSSRSNSTKPQWCLAGYPLLNTLSKNGSVSRALCKVDENKQLLSVRELKEIFKKEDQIVASLPQQKELHLTGQETVSMNFWGFTPAIFPVLENYLVAFLKKQNHTEKAEFYIPEAVNQMLTDNVATVQVLTSADQWMGVTYPEDKEEVKRQLSELIATGQYPQKLWPSG
ncbi:nucleotidyltransferase family protein [Adhaeribacter swui]|nr:nucleotidyltransferase [Adhaeribacter swui]